MNLKHMERRLTYTEQKKKESTFDVTTIVT